jgi:hypothetical protein
MKASAGTTSGSSRSRKPPLARIIVGILVPPAAILAAIHSPPIGEVAAHRPGLLAMAILAVALALYFPHLRRLLLVVFATAASFIALIGTYRSFMSGPPAPLRAITPLYQAGWALLLALAAAAATVEIVRPGTVLAKRLLFAAAAIFLVGHGIVGIITMPNLLSATALLTGIACFIAVFLAHRLTVPPPSPAPLDIPSAEALAAERRKRLRTREWHDPASAR